MDTWEALWALLILLSFCVGFWVIWHRASGKGRSQLLWTLVLFLYGLGSVLVRTWWGNDKLDVGLYVVKSLTVLAVASLMILVFDHLPHKVSLSATLSGRVMILVPLLFGDILVTVGPLRHEAFVQLFGVALALCGLVVGGLLFAGFRNSTPLYTGHIVSLAICSFVLIGFYATQGALAGTRAFRFLTSSIGIVGPLAAFSFIVIFSPFANAYRFMEIEPTAAGRRRGTRTDALLAKVSKGSTYIFESDGKAMEAFSGLVLAGLPGLCVTRQHPEKIRERLGLGNIPVVWLTREKSVPEALGSSNISVAGAVMLSFLEKVDGSVILFDGFEYLVTNNGFDVSLRYLYDLKDKISSRGSVLLMGLDLNCFDERQRALLQRNVSVLGAS